MAADFRKERRVNWEYEDMEALSAFPAAGASFDSEAKSTLRCSGAEMETSMHVEGGLVEGTSGPLTTGVATARRHAAQPANLHRGRPKLFSKDVLNGLGHSL